MVNEEGEVEVRYAISIDERFGRGDWGAPKSDASNARSLRAQPDGKVLITDGPYLETKEHIGGFWVLEAANLEDALAWGRKAVVECRAPVEVRRFLEWPTEPTERQ